MRGLFFKNVLGSGAEGQLAPRKNDTKIQIASWNTMESVQGTFMPGGGEEDEELAGLPEAERLERQQLKKRKGEILAALNAQTAGQTLTIDSV